MLYHLERLNMHDKKNAMNEIFSMRFKANPGKFGLRLPVQIMTPIVMVPTLANMFKIEKYTEKGQEEKYVMKENYFIFVPHVTQSLNSGSNQEQE